MTTAPARVETSTARQALAAAFDATDRSHEPEWLAEARRAGRDHFADRGFPTRKDEDWKYTDLRALEKDAITVATAAPQTIPDAIVGVRLDGATVVTMSNGHVTSVYEETVAGLTVHRLADALENPVLRDAIAHADRPDRHEHALTALNTAHFTDAIVLEIAEGATIEAPIQLIHVASGGDHTDGGRAASFPRVIISAGAGSRATIVESWIGATKDERAFTCAVIDAFVAAGARLDHVVLEDESRHTVHVGVRRADVARDATYSSNVVSFGGEKARNELYVKLAETGAHCDMLGLYDLDGGQHVDNHTVIDHAVGHTTSRELYKGVLDDKSTGVFFGRILVREDAQQISADQTNNNLLLSDEALVNSTPQLEIYADDVQCRHGSTIGQIEGEALYYLRSRGIPLDAARELLTFAFANEILDAIPVRQIRERLALRLTAVPDVSPFPSERS